jgi:hypothetical protein
MKKDSVIEYFLNLFDILDTPQKIHDLSDTFSTQSSTMFFTIRNEAHHLFFMSHHI